MSIKWRQYVRKVKTNIWTMPGKAPIPTPRVFPGPTDHCRSVDLHCGRSTDNRGRVKDNYGQSTDRSSTDNRSTDSCGQSTDLSRGQSTDLSCGQSTDLSRGQSTDPSSEGTGYFRKVYRSLKVRVPRTIPKYLSIQILPQKLSHQSIYLSNSHKRNIHILFSFYNKYKYM